MLSCLDFSPDGSLLVSGSSDNTIKLWNVADGHEILTLQGHSAGVNSVSFSPDGKFLASGSKDQHVKLWNFDLDQLLLRGCQQIRGYLEQNPKIQPGDRTLCRDILSHAQE
jgi:WD40 repeat protein